jgi:hypothetical protein
LKMQIIVWRNSLRRLAMECEACGRNYYRLPWRSLRPRWRGVRMAAAWYCQPECLQMAITEILEREQSVSRREASPPHRVPLGLLLLSRQQLTTEQLRAALEGQRNSGSGRIGEWVERLGFATEAQVTSALARQWSCPVLRMRLEDSQPECAAAIPLPLLESFQMIPVELSEFTGTLLIAFSEAVDYGALYAIEQMLGVRTEPCFVVASALRKALAALAGQRKSSDVIFRGMENAGACARMVASYAEKVLAGELRLARCGDYIWVRLQKPANETVNLVLEAPRGRAGMVSRSSSTLASTA